MIHQGHITGTILSRLLEINRFGDPTLNNDGSVYLIIIIK